MTYKLRTEMFSYHLFSYLFNYQINVALKKYIHKHLTICLKKRRFPLAVALNLACSLEF
jgi:hypothetical protein